MPVRPAATTYSSSDTAPTVRTSLNTNVADQTSLGLGRRSVIQAGEVLEVYTYEQQRVFDGLTVQTSGQVIVDGAMLFDSSSPAPAASPLSLGTRDTINAGESYQIDPYSQLCLGAGLTLTTTGSLQVYGRVVIIH